jgi:hypothetical protein
MALKRVLNELSPLIIIIEKKSRDITYNYQSSDYTLFACKNLVKTLFSVAIAISFADH